MPSWRTDRRGLPDATHGDDVVDELGYEHLVRHSLRTPEALRRQRTRQDADRARWGAAYVDKGLIFARENGEPIRPERVLRRFRTLTAAAGLPKVRVHDLRHPAASMMIAAGVPLPIVSKTLRHSTVSITSDIYTHLTAEVAREAVDAMAAALGAAEAEAAATRRAHAVLDEPAGSAAHSPRTHREKLITAETTTEDPSRQ